jgi:hypothetical protein
MIEDNENHISTFFNQSSYPWYDSLFDLHRTGEYI